MHKLDALVSPDLAPLMVSLTRIIAEDNRRGVLAGTDRDGRPMAPVTYRPIGKAKRVTAAQRNKADARLRTSPYAGFGAYAAGLHNNLTRAEYERLGGPPLAPRGYSSRVITNLKVGWERLPTGVWKAYGYWDEVVSTRGIPFLHAHFVGARTGRRGATALPRRDLRGVRPEGMARARKAIRNYVKDLVRASPHG
jgi:hypothetical protein